MRDHAERLPSKVPENEHIYNYPKNKSERIEKTMESNVALHLI